MKLSELVPTAHTKPSIYVAIPTCRDWKAGFGVSMIGLTNKLTGDCITGKLGGMHFNCKVNSLLPGGRQAMLNDAIEKGFSHILWIDDDTQFPAEALDIFLSRKKPIICANMTRKIMGDTGVAHDLNGQKINSSGKTGIDEVSFIGMGFALMEVETLKKIGAPHFEIMWIPERQSYLGEDMYLSEKLRQAGVKLYIDNDVSNMTKHIGDFGYGFKQVEKHEVAA